LQAEDKKRVLNEIAEEVKEIELEARFSFESKKKYL